MVGGLCGAASLQAAWHKGVVCSLHSLAVLPAFSLHSAPGVEKEVSLCPVPATMPPAAPATAAMMLTYPLGTGISMSFPSFKLILIMMFYLSHKLANNYPPGPCM